MPAEENLRRLAQRRAEAHENDRMRVARQLHDDLGQTLTLLRMNCSWLTEKLPDPPPIVTEKLQAILRFADDAIRTTRRLSGDLRPGIMDLGIAAAIEWHAGEFHKRTGIHCTTELCQDEDLTSSSATTELFRIFQEALLNVQRHAGANAVSISLTRLGSQVVLEIQDDGAGITSDQTTGLASLGILDMRERAARLGATFSIQGNPGAGTTVTVGLPSSI